jgi:eukaryotic-like serine/threonine-protein kinase
MLGKLLDGRYQVVQILSSGGFGETYIAQDTRRPGNPKCVLKLLKPGSSSTQYLQIARRLFNSEAEILEQLGNHDQIPRLLAYFEEDEQFFLVQELIVGHPLSNYIRSAQPWSEAQVIQMLQDVLQVLDFVHSFGVIHRDIKPDNLIKRDADAKLVLIDFGAVKQMRTQMAADMPMPSTVAIGTPGYMSAEQAQGRPRQNSDIYALGIIAIQALTGLLPSQFSENPETGEIIWQDKVHISPRLQVILEKMVRYHFTTRYQSANEVLRDIEQLTVSVAPTQPVIQESNSTLPGATVQQVSFATHNSTNMEDIQRASEPPAFLIPTLKTIRYIPFAGATTVFMFKDAADTLIILLGVVLIGAGVGLFLLRSVYSRLARDYDAVFSVVFCLCGILFIFQDKFTTQEIQTVEYLLSAAAIFSACNSILLRQKLR